MFTHRGLTPHQFTPMSGAHQITSLDAAMTLLFHAVAPYPAVRKELLGAAWEP